VTGSGRRVHGRHSRRRRIRRALLALVLIAAFALVARRAAPLWSSLFRTPQADQQGSFWREGDPGENLAIVAASSASAPLAISPGVVYPYSIVPGGVRSPEQLFELSQHDPAIGRHYEGFDFHHARIIELAEPKLVYLSYRIGNNIFWTHKKVALRKGEKLITDGKMTARTRCANRVSETAQKAVSPEEPPAGKFEEPFLAGGSTTEVPFPESATRSFSGFGAVGPPALLSSNLGYAPIWAMGLPPVAPPPVPGCPATSKSKDEIDEKTTKNKPCPSGGGTKPPPTVPEPGTFLLISSGLAAIYWRSRSSGNKV
jgi:PEP-CTERM motif